MFHDEEQEESTLDEIQNPAEEHDLFDIPPVMPITLEDCQLPEHIEIADRRGIKLRPSLFDATDG